MKRTVFLLVAAAASAAASDAPPRTEPPAAVLAFSRTLPAYFAELENYVASERTSR